METEGFLAKDDNLMIRKNRLNGIGRKRKQKCWTAEIWKDWKKDSQLNDKKKSIWKQFLLRFAQFSSYELRKSFLCILFICWEMESMIESRCSICVHGIVTKKYADNIIISSFETWILNRNCLPHQNSSDSFNKFKIGIAEQILV